MALTNEQFEKLKSRLETSKPMDAPVSTPTFLDNVKSDFTSRVGKATQAQEKAIAGEQGMGSAVLQTLGQGAGFVGDIASQAVMSAGKAVLPKRAEQAISETTQNIIGTKPVQDVVKQYESIKQRYPEAVADLESVLNIASILPIGSVTSSVGKKALSTVGDTANEIVNKTGKSVSNTIDAFDDIKLRVSAPDVTDATRVSLNPVEALKESGQDFKVSVGGKVKSIADITPTENMKLKVSTEKSLDSFKKKAELYKNDRNPLNDPTEIVGQRIDASLSFADKKRQAVGSKMGDIELKYAKNNLPVSENTVARFTETIKDYNNPKFGADTGDAQIVRKLVSDFDRLGAEGSTVGDRLEFIRAWERYLNDAKDGFGNFKDNATVNTRIQNAVKTLKNETVDYIARTDKTYRNLRSQYRLYKELDDTGNRLLGKEGMLGDRIKGGATVKRAIKSNSDAGARQFLTKLKEVTGYDALKDGDLALTAMELVGDYQGLSLLEVLKEGKTGIVAKGLEKIQDKLVGGKEQRIRQFIRK